MPGRIHQNDAPSLTLDGSIAVGDTIIPVQESITGVETPISYTINSGGANQEIVTLTSKNTSTSPSQFEGVVRGCDGTTDQSHSSGEVLTHEATARDFVDTPTLYSENIKPSPRLVAFDDFARSDRQIDGDQLPSGQTWDASGDTTWKIQDQEVVYTNFSSPSDPITYPISNPALFHKVIATPGYRENKIEVYVAYQDTDNWIRVRFQRGDIVVEISVGGTVSNPAAQNFNDEKSLHSCIEYTAGIEIDGQSTNTTITGTYRGQTVEYTSGWGADADFDSILENVNSSGILVHSRLMYARGLGYKSMKNPTSQEYSVFLNN